MRVSKQQKANIRRKLLETAVSLFMKLGYEQTTMREISTAAGFSPSTVYSYFPSKETIFSAYFEEKQEELLRSLDQVEGFSSFGLKEKLQMMLEMQLDLFLPSRAFVAATFKALLDSPMRSFTDLQPAKDRFVDRIESFLAAAVSSGEMAGQPYHAFISSAFWDYKNLVVLFWLRDDSKGFVRTSRLIDMSLDLYVDAIRCSTVTKVADVLSFLVRSHLFGNIERLYEVMGLLAGLPRRATAASQP
jgi:AcrR family transcriptional regulator